ARRATTTVANSSSRTRYGPQILFAKSRARGRREATASSCETAVTTVATVIPALIGESAMVSIRPKLLHRLRTPDLLIEQALDDARVVTGAIKRVVRYKLRLSKERPADSEDGPSGRYEQRARRRPAEFPDNSAKTRAVGHPLAERELKSAAELVGNDYLLRQPNLCSR